MQDLDKGIVGLNEKGKVFFFDHDQESNMQPVHITFEKWITMASIYAQVEQYIEEGEDITGVLVAFNQAFDNIQPSLSECYPYEIDK